MWTVRSPHYRRPREKANWWLRGRHIDGQPVPLAIGGTPKLRGASGEGAVFDVCYPLTLQSPPTCAVGESRVGR